MSKYLNVLCTKKQRKMLFLLLFASLISVFFEFISIGSIPVFASILIDSTQDNYLSRLINLDFLENLNQKDLLLYGSIILGIIFLIKNCFFSALIYFEGKLIKSIRITLGDRLFRTYLDKEYKFHLKTNPSILLRNVSGEVSKTTTVLLNFLKLAREALVLFAIFLLLILSDFVISFSIFFFMAFFVIIFFRLTKKIIEKNGRLIQKINAIQIQHITQSYNAIKEIKMLNKEDYINKATVKNMHEFENPYLVNYFLTSLPRLFLETLLVFGLTLITLLLIGLNQSLLSIFPTLTLLVVAALRLIPSFNGISSALANIKNYRPSYKLVYSDLLNGLKEKDEININNKNLSFENKIGLENINFAYEDKKSFQLEKISLIINVGSKIGIVGKSGSGKSTFINLITGLLKPDHGSILTDGEDIKQNIKKWQSLISYVPQDIYLLDDSIKKNIAIGELEEKIDKARLSLAIKSSELTEYINGLPEGLDTIVGNRGVRISGGQKQRIGIARALYFNRKILILDEATNSLDEKNEKKILNNIMAEYQSKTIICIAHNNEIFQKFDQILNFDEGKITKKGTYKEVVLN
tara:strand:+ start:135 stop:1874 length:1740 start_codon:yes stop_codon:yes gene_type:complete